MEAYPPAETPACDTPADGAAATQEWDARDAFGPSRALLEQMTAALADSDLLGAPADRVEDFLSRQGRELQRLLLQDHLDLRAAREERLPALTGTDQVTRRRAEPGRVRQLATTIGRVEVSRMAYRAPGASALHPADAVLALPRALHSYPLRLQVAYEAAAGSLRQAQDALNRSTGQHLGTRQLMEICTAAVADVDAFYGLSERRLATRGRNLAEPDELALVLSVDATGINMIPTDLNPAVRADAAAQAERPQPPSAKLSARERTGRRRMATVTAVFNSHPAPRTPADIMPATATERSSRNPGPVTSGRVVHTGVTTTTTTMIYEMFQQANARDPQHRRRWIALVDGNNHQIDRIHAEAAALGVEITIYIDIIHVIEYCWRAAEDLHRSQHARASWVNDTVRTILEGRSARVVGELRTELADRTTNPDRPRTAGIARTLAYLDAKQPYLAYHIALTIGLPIATGVIEGCCRFLVKDRLDVTGARWSLDGAQAILTLREVITNGDMDQYWAFHLEREHERTHATRYPGQLALAA
jgi:hypothetical protein